MVLAFIPVRGGSKSIPLKNIKLFCGRPLVWWNVNALEDCSLVDKIVIATDSDQIADVVGSFGFTKTEIYRRSAENASDTASTESVMLEYLNYAHLDSSDTFVLAQATSPLTQTKDFSGALALFGSGKFDSVLSCVRNKRFFWNDDGTAVNYDYHNRPRRQDFAGKFMENGALYINSVGNILRDRNRLSGKIGIYEMDEITATEIDEPSDWIILENLKRNQLRKCCKGSDRDLSKIRLVISDVDGVLTDGGMYYSESGDEQKKFNTKDGMAFQILREHGIKTAIITSENTKLVERRADKLKIDFLKQGKRNGGKLEAAKEICAEMGISLQEVAFIGDDINDLELLQNVGFAFCPSDAQREAKIVAGIRCLTTKGGEGCIRELCGMIMVILG